MDYEMMLLYGTIGAAIILAAYKKYKQLMADGELSIGEVLELGKDLQEIANTIPSHNKLKRMKKAELQALCEELGLDTDGFKADLIERIGTITVSTE